MRHGFYRRCGKRLLDLALSTVALAVLALPMLVIGAAVRLTSPGPALFWQRRVGARGTYFMMPKFRTMRTDAPHDVPTHLLRDPGRYFTPIGQFLRKTSLDEIVQVWSIFTGKMSFIGPRPALWNQDDLLAEREKYGANDVRPGLSGWAQINGRDELPVEVKARFDGEYVEKMSFLFDCRCFLGTAVKVLRREGVAEGGPGRPEEERELVEK